MLKYLSVFLLFFVSTIITGQDLTASQKIPGSVMPGTEFTVETTINRGSVTGFMKFFQELPEGFTATDIDSRGGSFTFVDNGAKVVWLSPPTEAVFTISYKVSISKFASGAKKLPAKIFYISGNERKILDLEPKTILVGNGNMSSIKKDGLKPAPVNNSSVHTVNKPIVTKQPATTSTVTPPVTNPSPSPAISKSTNTSTAASQSQGKIYKVQIGAYSAKPKMDGVPDISTLSLDNGITKYYSGSFSVYEDALKRRTEMQSKGFKNAFIVTFVNGQIVK